MGHDVLISLTLVSSLLSLVALMFVLSLISKMLGEMKKIFAMIVGIGEVLQRSNSVISQTIKFLISDDEQYHDITDITGEPEGQK